MGPRRLMSLSFAFLLLPFDFHPCDTHLPIHGVSFTLRARALAAGAPIGKSLSPPMPSKKNRPRTQKKNRTRTQPPFVFLLLLVALLLCATPAPHASADAAQRER